MHAHLIFSPVRRARKEVARVYAHVYTWWLLISGGSSQPLSPKAASTSLCRERSRIAYTSTRHLLIPSRTHKAPRDAFDDGDDKTRAAASAAAAGRGRLGPGGCGGLGGRGGSGGRSVRLRRVHGVQRRRRSSPQAEERRPRVQARAAGGARRAARAARPPPHLVRRLDGVAAVAVDSLVLMLLRRDFRSFVNTCIAFLGSGVLGLPFAFKKCGLLVRVPACTTSSVACTHVDRSSGS
jgi:hypothetical protein